MVFISVLKRHVGGDRERQGKWREAGETEAGETARGRQTERGRGIRERQGRQSRGQRGGGDRGRGTERGRGGLWGDNCFVLCQLSSLKSTEIKKIGPVHFAVLA